MADQVVLLNQRPHRAGRHAARALRAPGHHLRGALHRHAAHEPGGAGSRRPHRRQRGRHRACTPQCNGRAARGHRARCRAASPPRSGASSTWAPTWCCAAPIGARSAAGARRAGGHCSRAGRAQVDLRWAPDDGPRLRCRAATPEHRLNVFHPRRESHHATQDLRPGAGRPCWPAQRPVRRRHRLRARPGAGGTPVLLPGRGRRPDRQDHRRLRRRLHEGEPRHQGHADLRRHLPGDHRQGAHRAQVGHAAGHLGAAVDRHVHADRRRRDRALRRLRQDAPRTRRG